MLEGGICSIYTDQGNVLPIDEHLQAKKVNPHVLKIKTYPINQQTLLSMKQKHTHTLYFC